MSVIVTQVGAGLDEPLARTLMGKVVRTAPRKGNTGNCIFDDTSAVTNVVLFSHSWGRLLNISTAEIFAWISCLSSRVRKRNLNLQAKEGETICRWPIR
jgi:hypothetical protein